MELGWSIRKDPFYVVDLSLDRQIALIAWVRHRAARPGDSRHLDAYHSQVVSAEHHNEMIEHYRATGVSDDTIKAFTEGFKWT